MSKPARPGILLVLAVIFGGLVLSGIVVAIVGSGPNTAQSACEDATRDAFSIPATAQFRDIEITPMVGGAKGTYTLAGHVEAANEPRDLALSNFSCTLDIRQGHVWHVMSVSIGPALSVQV
jgi:hypothetical protein